MCENKQNSSIFLQVQAEPSLITTVGESGDKDEKLDEYLSSLRILLKESPYLASLDDEFLTKFIRGKKYNLMRTAQQLKTSWNFLQKYPEVIPHLQPSKFKGIFETFYSVMKIRSEGRHIVYMRGGAWDTTKITLDQIVCTGYMTIDHMSSTKETQLNGILVIIDFRGFGLSQVLHSTPKRIHMLAKFVQGSYPVGFKGFHLLCTPVIANGLFLILKRLLKEKMQNRLFFHGHKYEERLVKAIGANALPEFLGGNIPNDNYEDKDFFPSLYKIDGRHKELIHLYSTA